VSDRDLALSEIERDAITELANIGVSRAASSLRKMVGQQVLLSVPSVDILSRRAAAALISEREHDNLIAVQQSFSGAFDGRALLIFPQTNSRHLLRAIIGDDEIGANDAAEMEQEALAETGNIILNGCLGTIANMLRNSLALSLPTILRGNGTQLFEGGRNQDAEGLVLFLYINFSVRDRDIRGYIAMLMDLPALAAMRSLIGDFIKRYLPPEPHAAIDASGSMDEFRQLAGPLFASIEHSGVAVAVTNPRLPDTPFVFVNEAFTTLTGHTLAEVAGKSWLTLHGSESNRQALDLLQAAMQGNKQVKLEILCHRKDGAVFRNNMHLSPVRDSAGDAAYFLSTHEIIYAPPRRDVVDAHRRQVREDVADRLRAALSVSGGAAAWEWDITEGRIVGDARFASLYGLDFSDVADGISADVFFSNVHPEDQTRIRLAIDGMLQGAEVFSREYRIILPSGAVRWVHARGHCLIEHDRPVRFTGVLVDTTDQKRVAEELRIAQTAGGIGTFEYISGFATSTISPQFCKLVGLHLASDLPVRTINGLVVAGDPYLIEVASKHAPGVATSIETRIKRPDNDEVRWLARRGEYVRDADTAEVRFSGVIYDITDLKVSQEKLRDLNERLEERVAERTRALERSEEQLRQSQKMDAIGQLTGGVAHDFNNLLTIIVGNLEVMQRRLKSSGADLQGLSRPVDSAMRGAQRAASLTQRLLAFSRQQPLDPRPVDVSRLVSDMSDLLRRTIGEQVTVEAVLAGGLWRAHVDANQLEMAILNLTVNARDAMSDGGKLTIETSNASLDDGYAKDQVEVVPGQYVMVAVTDNGIGMDEETVQRAFEPFFTTKDVGHGTGLGLSQVYGFVKQSGGHVKIYSEPGEGTTVKIYLPRWHAGAEEVAVAAAERIARAHAGETILVVEDDDDVRAHTSNVIGELGYTVLQASNGKAALNLMDRHPEIQLLFTDVGLPGGMNGRQLADAARKKRKHLKVLFTTGYARNAIVHEGRLDPGVSLITKPFTFAALADKLRTLLDAKPAGSVVLVVEDEPLIQMLAKTNLEELGFESQLSSTAADARTKLKLLNGQICLAIVDIGLPDAKGDDLVKELRAIYPQLPLVVASGYSAERVRQVLRGVDRIGYLTKPYTLETMRDCFRRLGVIYPEAK
jgi:PAS domain S-box-containing protein